ncbi:MAG: hypothetical protein RH860_00720 [Cytophagales bacterium]
MKRKKKLAVWKFASCDGCQLSILDCEDELLYLADNIEIAYFPEATKTELEGPYDISLVEGSVTTAHDAERIQEIRSKSKLIISIGACATAGGIQALRNFADVDEYVKRVYAHPEYIKTLDKSTAIEDHVKVDYQLRGCPVNKYQLLEVLSSFLIGKKPNIQSDSVCNECKLSGTVCVSVVNSVPCLGPVTHAGCGALCPKYSRACFACYGPKESSNPSSLSEYFKGIGVKNDELVRLYRSFNSGAEEFKKESLKLAEDEKVK